MHGFVRLLLNAAKNSNGGGVWSDNFAPAAVRTCIENNWIKQKPGSQNLTSKGMLLIITKAGRAALDPSDVKITKTKAAVEAADKAEIEDAVAAMSKRKPAPWDL